MTISFSCLLDRVNDFKNNPCLEDREKLPGYNATPRNCHCGYVTVILSSLSKQQFKGVKFTPCGNFTVSERK